MSPSLSWPSAPPWGPGGSNWAADPPVHRSRPSPGAAWSRRTRRTGWSCTGSRRTGFPDRTWSALRVSDTPVRNRWRRSAADRFRCPAKSGAVGCKAGNGALRPESEVWPEVPGVGRRRSDGGCQSSCKKSTGFYLYCYSIAQSVELPSKVPVGCNSTEVGSNPSAGALGGKKNCTKIILAAPSGKRRDKWEEWEKNNGTAELRSNPTFLMLEKWIL